MNLYSASNLFFCLVFSFLLFTCNENEDIQQYTGNKKIYPLYQASIFPISGSVTISERRDGNTEFYISLKGTEGDIIHPVHLHYGDKSEFSPKMAIMLTSIVGNIGKSTTVTNRYENGQKFTYRDILNFEGHIRVHQDEVQNAKVVIAHGNIGALIE